MKKDDVDCNETTSLGTNETSCPSSNGPDDVVEIVTQHIDDVRDFYGSISYGSLGSPETKWKSQPSPLYSPQSPRFSPQKSPRFYFYGDARDQSDKSSSGFLKKSLKSVHSLGSLRESIHSVSVASIRTWMRDFDAKEEKKAKSTMKSIFFMTLFLIIVGILCIRLFGNMIAGPPQQPVGPYKLVGLQEGDAFWDYYKFLEGKDSAGSNGYVTYVSREKAMTLGLANITNERKLHQDSLDEDFGLLRRRQRRRNMKETELFSNMLQYHSTENFKTEESTEPFIYMKSSPTDEGPRESIRLEGKDRFSRGLFIIDLRHMPAGCGTWPAFWLTDDGNWPVNGEIDIVEGVNYQDTAKTALHSVRACSMDNIPDSVMTGTWDTALGVPDKKTGVPDMTLRNATDCFVYNPHQWLNQGCVAVDQEGGTLGIPINKKGGGVYALEWDPANGHIRSWVFSPHSFVPQNLMDSMRTAGEESEEDRVEPDPNEWGLPYGYFAIGDGTQCSNGHFRNMRLVFNLAFCGSVAGNRYWLDCKNESKIYPTCQEYIKSNPVALEEAYWKIRGVYVYQRSTEKVWL